MQPKTETGHVKNIPDLEQPGMEELAVEELNVPMPITKIKVAKP
jgi:hypothetical protein